MKFNMLIYFTGIYSLITLGVIILYMLIGFLSVSYIKKSNYKKYKGVIHLINELLLYLNILFIIISFFYDIFVNKVGVCLSIPAVALVQMIIAYIIIDMCYYRRFGIEFKF